VDSKVFVIGTRETLIFEGGFKDCLLKSKSMQEKTRFAVVVENQNGVRFSMADQKSELRKILSDG